MRFFILFLHQEVRGRQKGCRLPGNVWVTMPFFADVCLSGKKFSEKLLPNLAIFLFVGKR